MRRLRGRAAASMAAVMAAPMAAPMAALMAAPMAALMAALMAAGLAAPGAAAGAEPAPDDIARGKEIVEGRCFICHGAQGESSSPLFPRLAGQHAEYLARQLADYKSGRRKSSTMQPMVQELQPADFRALGAYFETQPVHAHAVDDAELAQVGRYIFLRGNPWARVAACAACHGDKGQGSDKLPRLAGQHAAYIEAQLKQFSQRERTNDNAVMHTQAGQLGELEIKAVAAYVSGLR